MLETLEQSIINKDELLTKKQIDTQVYMITRAVTNAIKRSTPWSRTSSRSNEYWSQECSEAVKDTRAKYYELLRTRTTEAEETHKEARRLKVGIIRKAKAASFRKKIEEVAKDNKGA